MKAVLNALKVVEELADAGESGVSELARRTGVAKSTVQRCLLTLADAGWIVAVGPATDAGGTRWRLSPAVHRLAAPTDLLDLRALAQPALLELRDAIGETVHLTMLEGRHVVLLDRVAGVGPVQVVLPIGHRVPAHAGATGKAILSALPAADLDALLTEPLEALTERTIVDPDALRRELARIRRVGWATNSGEWDRGIVAVAASIVVGGRPVGAVSVSTIPDRLPARRIDVVGPEVVRAARGIAAAAGG
jgi:IclR family acetate operon transcriptional repressor